MKYKDKKEASRIAYFGARKMDAAGYKFETIDQFNRWCATPAGGGYNVAIFESGEADCGCKFFEENAEFGVCKHTMRLRWLLQDERETFAREEAEDALAEASIREEGYCA